MIPLAERKCEVCRSGTPLVTNAEEAELTAEIPQWIVIKVEGIKRLQRIYNFTTYPLALKFTTQIAAAAEEVNHHPAILLEWGRVTVSWWSHEAKGLCMNDFIMAARTDIIAAS